jgi:hypothetical protein
MELFSSGVGLLRHQLAQPHQIHLHNPDAAHGSGTAPSGFPPALLDPTGPGAADMKDLGDLLGGHAAIIGSKDAVTQVLGICSTHPWLLEKAAELRPPRSYNQCAHCATERAPNGATLGLGLL